MSCERPQDNLESISPKHANTHRPSKIEMGSCLSSEREGVQRSKTTGENKSTTRPVNEWPGEDTVERTGPEDSEGKENHQTA